MRGGHRGKPARDTGLAASPTASAGRARLWFVGVPSMVGLAVLSVVLIYLVGGEHAAGASAQAPPGSGPTVTAVASTSSAAVIPHGGASGQAALHLLGSNALPLPDTGLSSAKAWNAGRGGTSLTAVTDELGAVTQEGGVRNFVAMKGGCRALATGIRAAQAAPPIPDASLQALYAKALTTLAGGASACQSAISLRPDGEEYDVTAENQNELHQATSAFAAGAKDIYGATAEIRAVSRH
jgi:hypothetical protein